MALSQRDVILTGIAILVAWLVAGNWFHTLRWAGYAFVVGLLLPVAGLIALLLLTSRGSRYDSKTSPRPRGPVFLDAARFAVEKNALRLRQAYEKESLYPESSSVSDALDDLLELIVRDFVNSWYSNISKNPAFSNEVDRTIRMALASLRDRLLGTDLVEVVTTRIVPILTTHFKDFYDAERAIRGKSLNRSVTESEELDLAIAGKYNEGKLHQAASLAYSDTKLVQQEHLRKLVTRLLPEILPGNVTGSRVVGVLVKELVACAVLSPVMQLLAEPDTWNQLMEAYVSSF